MHIETFFEILGGCLQILNVTVMKNGFDRLEKKLETTKSDMTDIKTDIVKLKTD